MLISEAYNRYINEFLLIRGVHKEYVIRYKTGRKLAVEIIGDIELKEITMDDVSTFTQRLYSYKQRRSNTTVSHYVACLRIVLRYWKARGEEALEPSLIPIPKRNCHIPACLTPEEVEKMIQSTDDIRSKFVISFLYSSGVRVSEFSQLNKDSVRSGQFTVIGKGSKPRLCFIDARTKKLMEQYFEERDDNSDAIATTVDGHRMQPYTVQKIIKEVREEANIDKHVTPHTFRHSFATNFIKNGGGLRSLQMLLGHSHISTVQIYTHLVDNDLKESYLRYHNF